MALLQEITISWHISDVLQVRPYLTNEQASDVLAKALDKYHQKNIGINFDTIKAVSDELFPPCVQKVTVEWTLDDVLDVCRTLTAEQASQVLLALADKNGVCAQMTWETIKTLGDALFPEVECEGPQEEEIMDEVQQIDLLDDIDTLQASADIKLFGELWPLREGLQLDVNADRKLIRAQVKRLNGLGYYCQPESQTWHKKPK